MNSLIQSGLEFDQYCFGVEKANDVGRKIRGYSLKFSLKENTLSPLLTSPVWVNTSNCTFHYFIATVEDMAREHGKQAKIFQTGGREREERPNCE